MLPLVLLADYFICSDVTSTDKDDDSFIDKQKNEASQFEERKQKKAQLEIGISLFSQKPKKGLVYLIENGFLENSPDVIAQFLLNEARLDRTAIGELLGEPDEKYIAIMHQYIDLTDFSKTKTFLAALRHFLVCIAQCGIATHSLNVPFCLRAIFGFLAKRKRLIV